jgi:hypothetical protein
VIYNIHKFLSLSCGVSLHLERRIFDNIYDLASHISYYDAISWIMMPDFYKVLKLSAISKI